MLLLDPQELEYLLEHLGHPETLKEKKFQEWLLDNDHRQLFELSLIHICKKKRQQLLIKC